MNIVTVSFLRSNPVGTLQKNTFQKTSPCVQLIVQARGWGTVATSCTFSFPLPSHHFYVYPMTLQWNNWICFHIVPFFFFSLVHVIRWYSSFKGIVLDQTYYLFRNLRKLPAFLIWLWLCHSCCLCMIVYPYIHPFSHLSICFLLLLILYSSLQGAGAYSN